MTRLIWAVALALMFPAVSLGEQSLVGTYRLVSWWTEIDGEPKAELFGKNPKGYIVITPKRFIVVITAEGRKAGLSVSEKAALWETVTAYSGPYEIEGSKLITSVDVSWNETWNGTKQVRFWQVDGNRLVLSTEKAPYARDPSKMRMGQLVWEKIE